MSQIFVLESYEPYEVSAKPNVIFIPENRVVTVNDLRKESRSDADDEHVCVNAVVC